MRTNTLPSVEYLNECFVYEPNTGILRWKARPRSHFATNRAYLIWLKRYANKPAGAPKLHSIRVSVNDCYYKAHRLIWVIQTGNPPQQEIDHINGNPLDNRWNNLREASHHENSFNSDHRTGRRHPGLKGAYLYKHDGKRYVATAKVNGKTIHLGIYDTEEEAHTAWLKAVHNERGSFLKAD